MKFDEIKGAAVIKVSSKPLKELRDYINTEIPEDGMQLKNTDAVDIGLAVGIQEEERAETEEPTDPLNFHSIDQDDVLKALIEYRHPEADVEKLRNLLVSYIEGGTRFVAAEISEHGYFDYDRYLSNSSGGE